MKNWAGKDPSGREIISSACCEMARSFPLRPDISRRIRGSGNGLTRIPNSGCVEIEEGATVLRPYPRGTFSPQLLHVRWSAIIQELIAAPNEDSVMETLTQRKERAR